ncbi:MAG: hypothetical protein ACYC6L_10555 [Anaerolineae bacterium]
MYQKWFVWTWQVEPARWDADIRCLNNLQTRLGPLGDNNRQVRAQVGSLVLCDPGNPVTIADLLAAIGCGRFSEAPFHSGRWCEVFGWPSRATQPGESDFYNIVEQIALNYLDGAAEQDTSLRYPQAAGFTRRVYDWLPPIAQLGAVQRLSLDPADLEPGCSPRDEIVRVYAYLGEEHPPTKEWLAACLWKSLAGAGNPAGLVIQHELAARALECGVSTRAWLDRQLHSQAST